MAVADLAGDLVAGRDEHRADERAGDRAHAADDEHGQQQHADVERVLLRVRAADGLDPQRAGDGDDRDAHVHAVQRGQNRSMPIAGAAISSSRVAMAKRPTRVSRNSATTTRAPATASQSHVLVPWRGTPESPPAPRVSSCQFLTT